MTIDNIQIITPQDILTLTSFISVDKEGDGFICREAMEEVRKTTAKARQALQQQIYVLKVHDKNGDHLSLHRSEEGAKEELYKYACDQWGEGLKAEYGEIASLSKEKAISHYFNYTLGLSGPETYSLIRMHLGG